MSRYHPPAPHHHPNNDYQNNNSNNNNSNSDYAASHHQQQQQRRSPQHQFMNMQNHPHHATPTPPMIMMERLLYNLHYKCCTYALQTTSRKSRFYAEHTILIIAICCFGALLLSHRTFVFYPSSISPLSSSSSLYFNNNHNHKIPLNYTSNSHHSHHSHRRHYIPTQCLRSIPGFVADTNIIDVTHLILINDDDDNNDDIDSKDDSDYSSAAPIRRSKDSYTVIHNQNREYRTQPSVSPHTTCSSSSMDTTKECRNEVLTASNRILRKNDRIMFSYAREKGYLFLSSSNTLMLPISTQYVYISKHDSLCFGEPFVQYLIFYLLYYILGPDTVMINWILGTFYLPSNSYTNTNQNKVDPYPQSHHSGYIYNPRTSVVIDIEEYKQQQTHYGNANFYNSHYRSGNSGSDGTNHHHWWIKRKLYELGLKFLIVVKTSFLFFITTTLVSFTLRETQGRMLQFTHTLQQQYLLSPTRNTIDQTTSTTASNPNMNTPQQLNYNVVVQLIMTHVLENVIFVPIIVGFIYFLINFYKGDKFLAFMVLTLVWVCESFSMVRYVYMFYL